jgi:hypothetical protein
MGVELLAAKSVHRTLSETESHELTDALCYPDEWMRAAEVYGISGLLKTSGDGCHGDGCPQYQAFGSLVIKNPHVADWFSVFCPVPGGMTTVRLGVAGTCPFDAFEKGVTEIIGTPRRTLGCIDESPQSSEDRTVVAAAAICSGIIAFARTCALLRFLGLNPKNIR